MQVTVGFFQWYASYRQVTLEMVNLSSFLPQICKKYYTIIQIILLGLVLTYMYDLLEDRCIDDINITNIFPLGCSFLNGRKF